MGMRIVHCIFGMNTGGAELLTVALVNELCTSNDVSVVIVNDYWDPELVSRIKPEVRTFFINRREGSRNPGPILELNLLLYRLRPQIIHCHDPKMGKLIKVLGAKLVYTIHAMGIPVQTYHHYDHLVAISDAVYNDVAPRSSVKMTTIYNGIPIAEFMRRDNYRIVPGEPFKIVQVSRLDHASKGQDIMINALALLKTKFNFPFQMDFVGKGLSLPYLEELVNDLGLGENTRFLGEKDQAWLYNQLATYHLLVQPSRYEGFGLTVLEGLAAGLPVLASDIDGPKELIQKTSGGLLFHSEDVESCAEMLYRFFSLYKENRIEDLMRSAIDLHTTEYGISACANNYNQLYEQLLKPALEHVE
jgi:glycosyltransferase involved in cell wall biosynthesis